MKTKSRLSLTLLIKKYKELKDETNLKNSLVRKEKYRSKHCMELLLKLLLRPKFIHSK